MINRLSIKIILSVLALVLLWLLWPGASEDQNRSEAVKQGSSALVSAIQPIAKANANSGVSSDALGVASGRLNIVESGRKIESLSNQDLASLTRRFDNANVATVNGNTHAGIKQLRALIADYPSVIEPYLNLASIYAEQQQLEKARATLLQGFASNPKAGMLFDHLKKIHGALAANAYRQALDTTTADSAQTRLVLERASNIVSQRDQSNQIAALQKQLQNSQNQISESVSKMQAEKVTGLESRLSQVEAASSKDRSAFELELSDLKQQQVLQSQALSRSQDEQREASARVVRAERDALNNITQITEELDSQKARLLAAQSLASQQADALTKSQQRAKVLASQQARVVAKSQQQAKAMAALKAENRQLTIDKSALAKTATELAKSPALTSTTVVATTGVATAIAKPSPEAAQKTLEKKAIGLVLSWARAWSAQDVAAYVGHYDDNYSSSRSLSRAQWLEQRRVRLTNKEFINVNVSSFRVKDLGSQFSITFSQYYQSNTVDDTVTKRLLFDKKSNNWSQSKIVNEQLVSG
ncbi:MAG: hypothetical protein ACI854_000553 [Arenicella sp.]|jgi:hypothetical protein